MQAPLTFTGRMNHLTRDLKLASPQVSFNCSRRKKTKKKNFSFSSKTKILINFVELFDLKTPQRLLHSSFAPQKKKNLRLFLQKFDRYDFIPLQKEVPCSNVKTKFIKSSSFRQVFGLFFVAIFTQDKEIVRFWYILFNLSLRTKYTVKLLFEHHGVQFFNLCLIAAFY